jgi:hypothetical protein
MSGLLPPLPGEGWGASGATVIKALVPAKTVPIPTFPKTEKASYAKPRLPSCSFFAGPAP